MFIERIVTALGQNSLSRADIVHTIESYSDVALIRSLLDGLIDMSAEFTMAVNELDLVKERLSALETALTAATSLPDAASIAPAPEAEAPVSRTFEMPAAKAVLATAKTPVPVAKAAPGTAKTTAPAKTIAATKTVAPAKTAAPARGKKA